jgi:hypothetical protein
LESPVKLSSVVIDAIYPQEENSHEININLAQKADISLMWLEGNLSIALITPSGRFINESIADTDDNITYYEGNNSSIAGYSVLYPEAGKWQINVTAVNVSPEGENYTILTFVATRGLRFSIR